MKKFWKYAEPPLFGLLVYFTVRLVNDTLTDSEFWKRDWTLNAIEISTSMAMGYLTLWMFSKLFLYFDRRHGRQLSFRMILKEVGLAALLSMVTMDVTITPMAALTDDGLSWGDVAVIHTIPVLYCIIYYTLTRSRLLLDAYIKSRILLERIQNEQLQTELRFLKAQLHPHFLFNALNTIYFKMDENVGQARVLVEKFSDLLRYQLYDQHQEVPIRKELDYLKAYIDLQKERMPENLQLSIQFDPGLNGETIYPLLLLPLVENAFKHAGGEYRVNILAKKTEDSLLFEVENSKGTAKSRTQVGGIGLGNLKRRLELLYPEKYKLTLSDQEYSFHAKLVIRITDEN